MPHPLHYLTIEEAAVQIRSAALSPIDLVEAHLERVQALNDTIHAFITITAEAARRAARRAEKELRSGIDRGPLHGIPIAHKDLILTKGVRTTAHSNLMREWIPSESATVVERLQTSGAISLGKTSLHEFAIGSPGPDEAFPAARNPWNIEHMPGSSSSGSGAAVAAGLCMGATGSDTGGSVRHPAAVCGLVGMKGTYGRVSNHGVLPLAPSMDHVGPITRSVVDNAIMLQAMAGHDATDSHSASQPVPDFREWIGKSVDGLRVGVPRRFIDSIEHSPEILDAFHQAERVLRGLGARIQDVDPDGLDESHDAGTLVILYEAFAYHARNLAERPEMYSGNFRGRFAKAGSISVADYESARTAILRLRQSVTHLFDTAVDLIINPARERPAQTMAELVADPLGKRSLALRMYSVTGNPALVLPMGFSAAGLPLALQIAGAHWQEERIYQGAHAYEQATRWFERHPVL